MSRTPFHPKRDILNHPHNHAVCPPPLKVHKDSHAIKKSSPPPPSLLSSSTKPQQRHPVIIYTHSPRVIHTHPRDFMALVQKLTGLSRSDNDVPTALDPLQPKQEPGIPAASTLTVDKDGGDLKKGSVNEDNETSSVITEENNCSSSIGDTQVNSCFMPNPPILDPSLNPYMTSLPVFTSNSTEFLCSNQPFLNYDPLFFSHNMRSSMNTSPATLEGMNDFREY
ncbi:VQ motif-containing protein 20 [Neltuma alba]|uniref:VQ motif-containing protein 20 n=1 Tax=Neltuma alba TaxID=207710 RepID=UPI0010A40E66|nr:VQ motif-containing protein 20 [Prosopis alba]